MNVTRAPQGNQPQGSQDGGIGRPGPTATDEALEQVRARIRAARGAAQQARRAATNADQALAESELLRRRLPVALSAAEHAIRSVRVVRRLGPSRAWYAGRGELAAERERRSTALRAALAERDELAARIAALDARAREYRAESLRLRASAAALPRLLDEVAACVRRAGGPPAEALAAAEAGLEPVLRRESDLDEAVRWIRWAQLHVSTGLDRLGTARTGAGYRDYFRTPAEPSPTGRLLDDHTLGGWPDPRTEAARQALGGVRDVLAVLCRSLNDLGVNQDQLILPELPADLDPWFTGLAGDPARQQRVTAALEACEGAAAGLSDLLIRVSQDHTATRGVLDGRRAHWCALLRGE